MFVTQVTRMSVLGLLFAVGASPSFSQATAPSGAAVQIESGVTTLQLNASFASALTGLGITPAAISPSILNTRTGVLSFPVISGVAAPLQGYGDILHSGGLQLSYGPAVVQIKSLGIDGPAAKYITGLVYLNGKLQGSRMPVFQLSSSTYGATQGVGFTTFRANGAKVQLAPLAVSFLNAALGSHLTASSVTVGTLHLSALAVDAN